MPEEKRWTSLLVRVADSGMEFIRNLAMKWYSLRQLQATDCGL